MSVKQEKKVLLAVDGNAILHRAWHAIPPLTDRTGRVVNAVYGFLSTLFRVVKDVRPTHLVVTFDRAGKTFRHDAYAEYKATRVKQPDELYAQIAILEDVLRAFGVPVFGVEGFEADDVLGTIVTKAEKQGVESLILTGDLDTLQLVTPKTKVVTIRKGITDLMTYDEAAVMERYRLRPDQLIDYKALRGDPSDNIKGVPGVGEKTASDLLVEFGSIEKIYAQVKNENGAGMKETLVKKLRAAENEATLAKDLVTIRKDLDLDFSLRRAALVQVPREAVMELLSELGFRSLIGRIPDVMIVNGHAEEPAPKEKGGKRAKAAEQSVWILKNAPEVAAWVKKAPKEFTLLVGPEPSVALLETKGVVYADGVFAVRALKALLEDPKRKKTTHDVKQAIKILLVQGIRLDGVVFDTMLADYLLAPGTRGHDLPTLSFTHLHEEFLAPDRGQENLFGQGPEERARVAEKALRVLARVAPLIKKELEERKQTRLLSDFEMSLARVLADVERIGVEIDTHLLKQMSEEFRERIEDLTKKIWKEAGEEFNISSPQQLKTILFEKLRIPTDRIRKTATGSGLSTAASELEKLRDLHPIVEHIFAYRELTKLKSTYIDALPLLVDPKTERVHTSYNQTVAATGRLSSSDPNLQNIPIRTDLGKKIRCAFTAGRGNVLIAADYSQVELRLAAAIAGAKKMIDAFRDGVDIHTRTAAFLWGIPEDKVTSEMRRNAKAVNFGIIYGIGPQGLAQGTGMSVAEAKEFIQKYFAANPEIREYMDFTKALAAKQGYVETVFGRRRYLPEIRSGMPQLRAAAERMAINHPIQGTEADILKLAMVRVHAALASYPGAKLILTVHDELVVEAPKADVRTVATILKKEMEGVYRGRVPMVVEIKTGKNWGELKPLE